MTIDRREFAAIVLGSLTSALGAQRASAQSTAPIRVNGDRLNGHLAALSQFGKNPQGGVSRVAYSQADIDARAAVAGWMRDASLEVEIDRAGNLVGRRAGRDASAKPIVFGSHIDSVPEGGNYDGDVGAMAAIEVAQTLAERRVVTRHPVDVVVWTNEEGGLYGSRAWSGQLTAPDLANVSSSGLRIDEGIRRIGGAPEHLADVRRAKGDVAAYFELHIEQGGILDAARIDIGIVEGIVGICEWDVTVTGTPNHAGTTPMDQRHDALIAAARFVEMVNRVVRSEPGTQVGTVGRIQAWPGAPNVIPGRVSCTLELRDLDDAKIASLVRADPDGERGDRQAEPDDVRVLTDRGERGGENGSAPARAGGERRARAGALDAPVAERRRPRRAVDRAARTDRDDLRAERRRDQSFPPRVHQAG